MLSAELSVSYTLTLEDKCRVPEQISKRCAVRPFINALRILQLTHLLSTDLHGHHSWDHSLVRVQPRVVEAVSSGDHSTIDDRMTGIEERMVVMEESMAIMGNKMTIIEQQLTSLTNIVQNLLSHGR